ncbi:hypothetical protein LCGC14_2358100 [marine sediment metagenome]|uniref:HTH cro/C1-type domain-containing protein n=1 Tax=marine sediment metagenome TaxID=412755 RepID=A0A0F9EJV8_9ZZZZ
MHPLTRRRRGKGLSMHGLAQLSGVAKTTIVKIENRQYTRDAWPVTLARLAEALGCEPSDLME